MFCDLCVELFLSWHVSPMSSLSFAAQRERVLASLEPIADTVPPGSGLYEEALAVLRRRAFGQKDDKLRAALFEQLDALTLLHESAAERDGIN